MSARRTAARWLRGEIREGDATAFGHWLALTPHDALQLVVDSPGGSLPDALSIAATLEGHDRPTTAFVLKADSAALLVAVACGRRLALTDTDVLVHDLSGSFGGYRERELDTVAAAMRALRREACELLARRSGQTPGMFEITMQRNDGEGERFGAGRLLRWGLTHETLPITAARFREEFGVHRPAHARPGLSSRGVVSATGAVVREAWQRHARRLGR